MFFDKKKGCEKMTSVFSKWSVKFVKRLIKKIDKTKRSERVNAD